MSPYMTVHTTAEQRLKDSYSRIFRNAFLIALAAHLVAFVTIPELKIRPYRLREKQSIEAISIPDQFEIPPPPKEEVKEKIVTEIAPSDDDLAEDTIASTELDVEAPPELPPPPTRPDFFLSYDEAPTVLRQVTPVYPEMATAAELEGVVRLLVGIDEFGNVVEAQVISPILGLGLEEAALDAIYQWKFSPAKQRDEAVPVRISLPIRFTLTG